MKVVCDVRSPVVYAFLDVFEDGDEWVKTVGCDGCTELSKCCRTCPMLATNGCALHFQNKSHKPYGCIITPTPKHNLGFCQQEFKCTKGSKKGQVRKVSEPNNVFH